jgi:hypothetical protein
VTFIRTDAQSDTVSSEHSANETDRMFTFSGGLDLRNPPHLIDSTACQKLLNMYYPREVTIPRTRPGTSEVVANTGTTATILASHVYRKSESVSYLCYTCLSSNGTKQELWYQTGTDAGVPITTDLGSLAIPSMVTFNGCLLLALPGVGIYEWQGDVAGTAAHGTAAITIADIPHDGDTITIGSETWTIKAAGRVNKYECSIGGTVTLSGQYLTWCIIMDSAIITATNGSAGVVNVTANRIGTAGNLAVAFAGAGAAHYAKDHDLSHGAAGVHLDLVTTNGHPHPGFMIIDQNQRLVASGDPAVPDRVFFSGPANHWDWATGIYGSGETFDLGYLDGMDIAAIQSMMGELVVHKSGQGREIWRINTADADPSTWTAAMKKFHANVSAINHRCATSVIDKHVFLDTRMFCGLTGTDTYDEISVTAAGMMLGETLGLVNADYAFMVTNPDENYILVFPNYGKVAWCFHYGTARWSQWVFGDNLGNITCGCYHDALKTVVLGNTLGQLLKLDASVCTDDGTYFTSEIISKSMSDGGLRKLLVKQTIIDWKHIIEGLGDVSLLINNGNSPTQPLFSFAVEDGSLQLVDATMHLEDATMLLLAPYYGRVNSFTQGGGEMVALAIKLNHGAWALNTAAVRLAYIGRVAE